MSAKGPTGQSLQQYLGGSSLTEALNETRDSFSGGIPEGIVNSLQQDYNYAPEWYKAQKKNLSKIITDKQTLSEVRRMLKQQGI